MNVNRRKTVNENDAYEPYAGDEFLQEALDCTPSKRSFEQILTIKSFLTMLDFVKSKMSTTRVQQLDDLGLAIRLEQYDAYKFVYKKGDYADKVYVVFSGRIVLVDSTQRDYEKHKGNAQQLFPGMIFGEVSVLENKPRPICALNDTHGYVQLLSLDKASYLKFVQSAYDVNNPATNISQKDSKNAHIMRLLDKPKQLRTSADIEILSGYLTKVSPYFRQFKPDQMRELCRIVETITFFSEKILFKQGQRSEAFFVILSGYVDVWVDHSKQDHKNDRKSMGTIPTKRRSSFDANMLQHAGINSSFERFGFNLGTRETTLTVGITFGERSIETASAIRLSSVVTGNEITELLVVPRDAYLNLISVLHNSDGMDKVNILRQTNVFRRLEAIHLSNFANIMRPITFCIGDAIYREGTSLQKHSDRGMTVIASGECFVTAKIELETAIPAGGIEAAASSPSSSSLAGRKASRRLTETAAGGEDDTDSDNSDTASPITQRMPFSDKQKSLRGGVAVSPLKAQKSPRHQQSGELTARGGGGGSTRRSVDSSSGLGGRRSIDSRRSVDSTGGRSLLPLAENPYSPLKKTKKKVLQLGKSFFICLILSLCVFLREPFSTATFHLFISDSTLKTGRVGPGTILYHFNVLATDAKDDRVSVSSNTAITHAHIDTYSVKHITLPYNDTRSRGKKPKPDSILLYSPRD